MSPDVPRGFDRFQRPHLLLSREIAHCLCKVIKRLCFHCGAHTSWLGDCILKAKRRQNHAKVTILFVVPPKATARNEQSWYKIARDHHALNASLPHPVPRHGMRKLSI